MKKRIISLMLTLVLSLACVFGLTACGGKTVKIGAQNDTTGFYYAECLKGTETIGYTAPALAAQDMKNGNVDYLVVDRSTAVSIVNSISGLKMIDIALTTEEYAMAVDKNQAQLLADINGVLASKTAEIDAIYAQYNEGREDDYVGVLAGSVDLSNQAGQLVVATNAEFPPYEFTDGEKFYGIDMEIAKLIADTLGLELVIKDMAFEAVVTAVGSNGIDVGIAALSVTASRKALVNFSAGYFTEYQVVVCLEENTALDDAGTVVDILSVLCAGN